MICLILISAAANAVETPAHISDIKPNLEVCKVEMTNATSMSVLPTLPSQALIFAARKYIIGNFKTNGEAFAGRVIHDDGTTLYLSVIRNGQETVIQINKASIELGSVVEGRLKEGELTPGGRKVTNTQFINVLKVSAPSNDGIKLDGVNLKETKEEKFSDHHSPIKIGSSFPFGSYVRIHNLNGWVTEGLFVKDWGGSLAIKTSLGEEIKFKSECDLEKTEIYTLPSKDDFYAFNENTDSNNQYSVGSAWTEYRPKKEINIPSQGYKLHISVQPKYARELADALLGELRRQGISHKVATSAESYARLKGKFITIYPEDEREAALIADDVDFFLNKNGFKGKMSVIQYEKPVGKTGGIFARYGQMTKDDNDDNLVIVNRDGNAIDSKGAVILFNGKPISVNMSFEKQIPNQKMRKKMFHLLETSRALTPDIREQFKPTWVTWDPFTNENPIP